jgi:hypothetical protein
MQALLTDYARLVMLIVLCGLLWPLESMIPLYPLSLQSLCQPTNRAASR